MCTEARMHSLAKLLPFENNPIRIASKWNMKTGWCSFWLRSAFRLRRRLHNADDFNIAWKIIRNRGWPERSFLFCVRLFSFARKLTVVQILSVSERPISKSEEINNATPSNSHPISIWEPPAYCAVFNFLAATPDSTEQLNSTCRRLNAKNDLTYTPPDRTEGVTEHRAPLGGELRIQPQKYYSIIFIR